MKKIFCFIVFAFMTCNLFCTEKVKINFRKTEYVNYKPNLKEKPSLYDKTKHDIFYFRDHNGKLVECIVDKKPIFDEDIIQTVYLEVIKDSNKYVNFNMYLTDSGTAKFAEYTKNHIGESTLIELNGIVINNVYIQCEINTSFINCSFLTYEKAIQLISKCNLENNLNFKIPSDYVKVEKDYLNKKNNRKSPTDTVIRFFYYFLRQDDEWKKYIYSNNYFFEDEKVKNILNKYKEYQEMQIFVQKIDSSFNMKIPMRGYDVYSTDIFTIKIITNSFENIYIVNLQTDKKGNIYVEGIPYNF